MACASVSLFSIFSVCRELVETLSYPFSAQWRLDQTGQKPRLNLVFAEWTCHFVGLVVLRPIWFEALRSPLASMFSVFQFPSQIGAVLRSPTLQHLLSYTKDPIATTRFHFWISETLQEGKWDCKCFIRVVMASEEELKNEYVVCLNESKRTFVATWRRHVSLF